jgi:hypothetical protein
MMKVSAMSKHPSIPFRAFVWGIVLSSTMWAGIAYAVGIHRIEHRAHIALHDVKSLVHKVRGLA